MLTFNKTEKIKITYDQKKIVLKGESLRLELNLSVSNLLSIYSSGYGEGRGSFSIKLSDDYQKTPIEANNEVIVPTSVFPPFNTIPEDDNKAKPINSPIEEDVPSIHNTPSPKKDTVDIPVETPTEKESVESPEEIPEEESEKTIEESEDSDKSDENKTLDDVKKENPWYMPRHYSENG